ncbi:MAG: phage tail tape measure protein [Bacteroidaceae bacterium]|nr:phage tail tape measure protein [Bacteroidaceae bacterium]
MSEIRDIASLHLKVNSEEAKRDFEAVKQKVKELKEQIIEASKKGDFEQVEKLHKQLKPAIREMDSMLTNIGRIDAAMKNLSLQTPKELQRTLKLINAEMNSGKIVVGSEQWKEYEEQLKKVKMRLKELNDAQKVVTDSGLSMKDMLDIGGDLSMIAASVLQVKDSVAEFMRDNVNAYIKLDAEMANVQKYTGLTREQIELLNRELDKLDTRTSKIKLNQLVEEGGRGGLRSIEELVQYAKAADIINVALDELGEGATETIFKLSTIFGDKDKLGVEGSMMAVGSVVNDLSQNMVAQAPYITEYINRLSGIGAMAKMTIPQIAAYGAVLDANGQNVEKSATATSRLLNKMFQEPAKIAQVAGLEISSFTQLVKTDINAAFMMLLEHLNSLGKMDVLAPIFKEMNIQGDGATATLTTLAKNIELVKQKQQEAKAAYEDATSVIKESNVQNTTEEAKLEKKRKKLEEVKVALGEKLLPIMGAFTSTGTMMIKTLNALLEVFSKYKVTIITTGSAVLLYTGYIKAKNFITAKEITLEKAKLFLQEKSLAVLKKIGVFMKSNPWGIAIVALTAIVSLLIDYNRRLGKVSEGEKALGKIRDDAKQKVAEEESRLKALLKVAEDETASLENRKKAVNALNQIIPGYNAQLDETTGQYKANKKALDDYLKSLTKKYEIEGAKDMLSEMGGEKARLNIEKAELEADIARIERLQRNIESGGNSTTTQAYGTAGMTMAQYSAVSNNTLLDFKKEDLKDINEELDAIAEKEAMIFGAYGEDLSNSFAEEITNNSNINGGGGSGGGGRPSDDDPDDDPKKDISFAEQAAKEKWARQRAIEDAAYSRGEITYQQHIERLYLAELQYLDDCQAAYEQRNMTEENGYLQLLEKEKQLLERHNNELLNMSLDDLERQQREEQNLVLEDCYNTNNVLFGNEKVRDQRLFEINIDYLRRKAELYRAQAMSKEAHQIEQQIAQAEADEALRKQKEYAERLQQWRKEYSNTSAETQMKAELLTLDEMHKAGLVKEEEYQQLRKAIQEKYTQGGKFSDGGYGDMLTNMYTSIDAIVSGTTDKTISSMQKIGAVAQSTWAIAGAALEQYSAYSQACCDLEVSEIEKKYDKMIAAAGKNSTRSKQLEEKKEKEIAKVKTKYSKQAQKMEIAGAVAQTAVAAINAYASASKEHWLLGPIAAAMAIAAGAVQIATIQKQHQAQQAGYYTGGFTRKSADDREEVGVVHANEFVANAQATRNPVLSPFFSLVDYAQRNNTVGSLTADDVSHAIGTGAVVKATSTTANESVQNSGELLAVAGSISSNTKVVQRLNERLDEGIEAFMVMDGERGFDKKYSDYNRLKKNPKR